MSAEYFIDTSILVYANDRSDAVKREKAKRLVLDGLADETMALSAQVLSEFFVTVTRKIRVPLPESEAEQEIRLLHAADIVDFDFHLVVRAIDISRRHSLSYGIPSLWQRLKRPDALSFFLEDLGNGQSYGSVTVRNPFLK
jgi:predicted nucleic acid-binding protein